MRAKAVCIELRKLCSKKENRGRGIDPNHQFDHRAGSAKWGSAIKLAQLHFLENFSPAQTAAPSAVLAVTGELLLLNHKKHEFLFAHLHHSLCSRPVELTAYSVLLGVGINAEVARFVSAV